MEHRIDYIDYTEEAKPATVEKVIKGSHITIAEVSDIQWRICSVNREAKYAFANLDDFVKSRSGLLFIFFIKLIIPFAETTYLHQEVLIY